MDDGFYPAGVDRTEPLVKLRPTTYASELMRELERQRVEPRKAARQRAVPKPGYESLADVLDAALSQAQDGKGLERHAGHGEPFESQQIVQLGEWMGPSTVFAIGQACKKSIESTRLPDDRARSELLGAINYLAAAVLVIDRRSSGGER